MTEHHLDPTDPTDRSSFSEEIRRPEQFKDEFSKNYMRRISTKSRDVLSLSNGSNFDDGSSEFGSEFTGSQHPRQPSTNTSPQIARQEAKHVFWSKVLVGLVLLGSTSLLGWTSYKFVKNEEVSQFENQVSSSRYPHSAF